MRLLRRRSVIITLCGVPVAASAAAQAHAQTSEGRPWATVNVCNTAAAPNTIGVRASMPGSSSGQQERYMRFIVQYFSRADRRWHAVAQGGDSGYLAAGAGRRRVEIGRSFRIEPMAGGKVLLRGKVTFEWRIGDNVVRKMRAITHSGHRSSAGADPAGHSAARCRITAAS